jgi:hypothetical protein
MIRSLAISIFMISPVVLAGATGRGEVPLNQNLSGILLPPDSDERLVKVLLIGDSQMGQSSNRLAGQIQKWDADIVGRMLMCENQPSAGVQFTSVTGDAYGAVLSSARLALGEDHGDGNTGSHFHHSRLITVQGTIQPNFSSLAVSALVPGAPTRQRDFDVRKNARIAVYDRPGGFARFRVSELRGAQHGASTDFGQENDLGPTLTGTGAVKWFQREIRAAGVFGSPGSVPVGITIRDSNAQDSSRTLSIVGTLIHDSPQGTDFPDRGLVVSHISQSGWSAFDHLNTLNQDAIDATIEMNEGIDTLIVVLGHNREDDYNAVTNPLAYPINMHALANRIRDRHLALGFTAPKVVMVAPWPLGSDGQNIRLAAQTQDLFDLCAAEGYGFINLFDFFEGQPLIGVMTTPRGSFEYTMDTFLTHPGNAATASHLMQDIEWHFNPQNWADACRADLAAPFGELSFFDLAAYLALFNAEDAAADLAEPTGVLNFFDLAAYLSSYNAGCP